VTGVIAQQNDIYSGNFNVELRKGWNEGASQFLFDVGPSLAMCRSRRAASGNPTMTKQAMTKN
jgi:hypothetical protein